MPDFDTIELTLDDTLYVIEGSYEAEWVDNGIGGYEYWGARGVHHDWCYELESYEYLIYNDEGDDITESLSKELRSRIDSNVGDILNRRLADLDPPSNDDYEEPDDPPHLDYD